MFDLAKIKKVHFIGLGGIGVSALARLMVIQGKVVSGSDISITEIVVALKKLGVRVFKNHRLENLASDVDLVVYSPAVPENNPERIQAQTLNIFQLSYPQFLGELSRKNKTIAVSGTNGKSTTTAILGLILEKSGLDPTVIVGSKVSLWNSNLRAGLSNLLVLEACEHQANMLKIDPQLVVITNLEKDHLDYYQDLKHIINTFQEYVNKLSASGVLFINMDDQNLKKLKTKAKIVTYGIKFQAEVMAKKIRPRAGGQEFDLVDKRGDLDQSIKILLKIPGQFNVANVLAAAAVALHLGVNLKTIKQTVEKFAGIWRRFEKVGSINNQAIVISDYAHHPTAVQGTIQAAREFYPGQKIMAVFQPHHHNRTKKLFNEFVQSFSQADL
ncbi:UDP-N-acetylmuramate--L-alanine ligase, partial [Patescibacteria group bacterium]|nr:UDP-N-acetylmuramate--L-alanine ligase [Patescibacteria group bacterium]